MRRSVIVFYVNIFRKLSCNTKLYFAMYCIVRNCMINVKNGFIFVSFCAKTTDTMFKHNKFY